MKVFAYMPLHYGSDYLKEAIQSIEPFVDKIVILYSSAPTYGFGTNVPCPDTEMQLHDICIAASPKVYWSSGYWGNEGEHRAEALKYSEGYDLMVAIDADEVFDQDDFAKALELAMVSDQRYIGLGGYINFFKSFNYACFDGFTPIRITNLHNSGGTGVVPCKVYHFSCAQRMAIMEYKLLVHGHFNELISGWIDMYKAWTPETPPTEIGLHLVSHGLWQATKFDKETLPEALKLHENFNKEVIE